MEKSFFFGDTFRSEQHYEDESKNLRFSRTAKISSQEVYVQAFESSSLVVCPFRNSSLRSGIAVTNAASVIVNTINYSLSV